MIPIFELTFADPADYDRLLQGQRLRLRGIHEGLKSGEMLLEAGEEKIPLRSPTLVDLLIGIELCCLKE